jgi:hypothetical protein
MEVPRTQKTSRLIARLEVVGTYFFFFVFFFFFKEKSCTEEGGADGVAAT